MRPIITIPIVAAITMAGLSFSISGTTPADASAVTNKGVAVVELFTSQGCSSCPPADEAMIKLDKEFSNNVFFLSFHVDYWNYIGWTDPFSSAEHTERQRSYAEVFKLSSIYTPQVVVNGQKEFVGSRESQLRTTIQQQLKDSIGSVIELNAKASEEKINVSYKVKTSGKDLLNIAVVQLKATTSVQRGENNGHTLHHFNIVRVFKTIAVNKEVNSAIDLSLPAGLKAKEVRIIAYVQNKETLKITGAGEAWVE